MRMFLEASRPIRQIYMGEEAVQIKAAEAKRQLQSGTCRNRRPMTSRN